jgi:predicted dinucleotide-binding enzyme
MRIGIVGAGLIGGTLTERLTAAGHEVSVANSRDPDTLRDWAANVGAQAVWAGQAARGKDVVVVTIPEKAVPALPDGLLTGDGAGPAAVVDTCNYYPRQRDGAIDEIEDGMPESRWVERQLGHPVVKAFNNIYYDHLGTATRPATAAERVALPVAGDDMAAKAVVMRLVDELGFDPIDAGGIDESWRQQPGSGAYTTDLDATRLRRTLAETGPGRAPEWSARGEGNR